MKNFSDYVYEILEFYRKNGMLVDPVPKVIADFQHRDILDPFCPTGNYNPTTNTITVYVKNR